MALNNPIINVPIPILSVQNSIYLNNNISIQLGQFGGINVPSSGNNLFNNLYTNTDYINTNLNVNRLIVNNSYINTNTFVPRFIKGSNPNNLFIGINRTLYDQQTPVNVTNLSYINGLSISGDISVYGRVFSEDTYVNYASINNHVYKNVVNADILSVNTNVVINGLDITGNKISDTLNIGTETVNGNISLGNSKYLLNISVGNMLQMNVNNLSVNSSIITNSIISVTNVFGNTDIQGNELYFKGNASSTSFTGAAKLTNIMILNNSNGISISGTLFLNGNANINNIGTIVNSLCLD